MTTIQCFGDSISAGSPVAPSQTYINMLASYYGWTLVNNAVGGDMAIDQSWKMDPTTPADLTTIMVGSNDTAVYGSSTVRLNNYINAMRAMVVVNGGTNLVKARNMTKTGTWSNLTATGAVNGMFTGDATATATTTISGPVVYLGYLQFSTANSPVFEVWIDGVLKETVSLSATGLVNTGNGLNYGTVCRRYDGLSNTAHTVQIRNKSTQNLNLQWVCGQGLLFMKKPVFILNTPFKNAYNSIDSAANVTAFCNAVNSLATELQVDGFNVHVVDVNSIITPSDIMADNIHVNVGGHIKMYNALKTSIEAYATAGSGSLPCTPVPCAPLL